MFSKVYCDYVKGLAIWGVIMAHVVNYRTDDSLLFRVLYMLFFQGEAGVNAFSFCLLGDYVFLLRIMYF